MAVTGANLRASGVPFDLRRAHPYSVYPELDFDVLGHVNNAGAWAIVEEVLAQVDDGPSWPRRVEVEFREPILRGDDVVVCHLPPDGPDGEVRLWVLAGPPGASPTVRTSLRESPPSKKSLMMATTVRRGFSTRLAA